MRDHEADRVLQQEEVQRVNIYNVVCTLQLLLLLHPPTPSLTPSCPQPPWHSKQSSKDEQHLSMMAAVGEVVAAA